ncbi:MAG TPA: type II toxin-antitoxin system MqsA family antitoxin [Bryobacteraceae bacterium]|jgi:YgiT-type zinc finger domain-containing protein
MKCGICGGTTERRVTDLPFRIGNTRVVVVRNLPVLQCVQCGEAELDDTAMARVDELLAAVNSSAELEVIRYAA